MKTLKNNITDIVKEKHDYIIKGKLYHLPEEVEDLKLILMDKKEKKSFIRLVDYSTSSEGSLDYQASLNIDQVDSQLRKDNIDLSTHSFYLRVTFAGHKNPLVTAVTVNPQDTQSLFHTIFEKPYGLSLRYLSFRSNNKGILQLVSHVYSKENASYLADRVPLYRYIGNKVPRERVILFGGYSPLEETFNTWNFFLYLRRNHPDINAYYILDQTAPFYEEAVHEEDNILAFRSREYINKILQASFMVTDKSPEKFYPTGTLALEKHIKAEHWLLPAAPFGLTDESNTLDKGNTQTDFSKIFMNSRSEIRYVRDAFDVDLDKMKVTGLPASARLDKHRDDSYESETLFILPYIELPYIASQDKNFLPFSPLLKDEDFQNFLEESKLSAVIALPEEMRLEKEALEELGYTIIGYTDEEIIGSLQKVTLLITDYHPHALTYAVLNRAILFYHEDIRPNVGEDFYFEIYQNELPGDVATNVEDILHLLREYSKNDFNMKASFIKKTKLLFEYQDDSVYDRLLEHFEDKGK